MKKLIRRTNENIMAMANINKKRTGLSVNIWSDGQGCLRNKPDKLPRVKIDAGDVSISVSISNNPKVLAPRNWLSTFKQSEIEALKEGIAYVARNYDLFLKHYMDTDGSFDDFDLFNALKDRGEFK